MKQELVEKQTQELSTNVIKFEMDDFLEGGLEKDDIRIDKINIVQAMSTDVKAANKSLGEGDLYLSSNNKLVVKAGDKVEFTPLYTSKLVQVFQNKTKGMTWDTAQKGDWVATHAQSGMDMTQDLVQKDIILVKVMALFGLFHSKQFSQLIPYRFYFKSASFKAFQPLIMEISQFCEENPGKNQLDTVFTLQTKTEKNKKGTYFVPQVEFLRQSTLPEKAKALDMIAFARSLAKEETLDDSDELKNHADY